MVNPLEWVKVQLSVRLGWRLKGREAEAIRGFQATEADGVWHLQRGLERIHDPKQRAVFFTHGLEEESHADEFVSVYKQLSGTPFNPVYFERHDLYAEDDPAWKMLAFVHVGEVDATERFRLLRDALQDGPLRQALGKIIDDESGHVDLTGEMLVKLGAPRTEARREVRNVRLRRLWEAWLRTGKRAVDLLATVLLSGIYFSMGPFVAAAARTRLRQRAVEYDNNSLKRLLP